MVEVLCFHEVSIRKRKKALNFDKIIIQSFSVGGFIQTVVMEKRGSTSMKVVNIDDFIDFIFFPFDISSLLLTLVLYLLLNNC